MKINNRNKVNSTRIAIGQLIDVLNSDIVITDEDKGSEIKSVMQTKKNAFMRAKYLLGRLQALETADAKEIKVEWYDENIRALINAAENAMGELSKSMKEVIDTSDKGASINASIASKQEALDHMDDLHRGVYELEGIITSIESGDGLKDLKDADFKASYAEDFSYEGFHKPISGKYKAGYNKELDAVVISYDGTVGEIIECYGLRIALPKSPAKKSLFNYRKKKADQYWQRQPYPYGLTKETASIHIDYIEEEFRRRDEGFWFLNNGEFEYLTGAHYMLLEHCKTDAIGGYFHYRKAHRDLFYWLEAAWVDNRSLGVLLGKTRRTGATYCADAFSLTKAMSTRESLFGMTSKKDIDAKQMFAKLTNMFKNLPFFFKPINTGENLTNNLSFTIPAKRATKNSKEVDYNHMNTVINYMATKEDSYDGLALKFYISDECYAPNTKILMGDMSFKEIKDIEVGDYVTVEGGKKIKVKHKGGGVDMMYRIKQPHKQDYVVSSKHRLYFSHGNGRKDQKATIMTPIEYLNMSHYHRRITTGIVSSGFEFPYRELELDPYLLGYWLGDGHSNYGKITYGDDAPEARAKIKQIADEMGMHEQIGECGDNWTKITYTHEKGEVSVLTELLRSIGVRNNKHIPEKYLRASRDQRLSLLAGIVDSDGHKLRTQKNCYKLALNNEMLLKNVRTLVKELGIDCSEITHRISNFNTDVYELHFTDYNAAIPCLLERKKPEPTPYKNRRGKVEVEEIGLGKYVGVAVDSDDENDQRLILEDYTISMNCSKWLTANILTHWSMVRKTLVEGVNLKGKAFLLSTVEHVTGADGYDDDAKCGDRFRTLYEESRLSTRGANGRTTSGLYSIFISALDNYGGCIDKYGNCHHTTPEKPTYGSDGRQILQGVREVLKDLWKPLANNPAKLNDEKRKDPITEDDMFRIASEDSLFNVTKVQDQIDYNNNWELDQGRPPYKVGNFRYRDSTQDVVEFVETPTGRFHVSWLPDAAMANKHTMRGADIAPSYPNVGIFGIDPYKLNKVKSGSKGSKGAIVGYLMNHPTDGIPKEEFFLVYVNRPQSVDIFIEDAIMAMKYYSMPALIENNIIEMVKVLHRRGLTRFSMRRPDVNKLSVDERMYGGIPSTDPKLIMNQAFFLEKYIEDHVGFPSDSEEFRAFGEIGNCKFNELLTEFLQFDINNRTKYDATVAACLAVFGAQKYLLKNMRNKVVSNKTSIWNFNNQPKRIRNELQNA